MISREEIIERSRELGFDDIGFCSAEPFERQKEILEERRQEYAWAKAGGLDLFSGTDPATILPGAKSIIVVIEVYFREAFPRELEPYFGRCYLDDDRVTKDGLYPRIQAFKGFLQERGLHVKVPFNLPHRIAAARAGLGTFGKNCLFYSRKAAARSSWVFPITLLVDKEFEPDEPTLKVGCPEWCKNACMTACPTGALQGPRRIDPRKCISFLSYFGRGLTPRELREPMGLYIYGCDRCQNVCPRNAAWLSRRLPTNQRAAKKVAYFDPVRLLHMDKAYFENNIWPHMFYMGSNDIWRWKMNTARAMGNSLDDGYVPELLMAARQEEDERVRAMCAWALGRIGGRSARDALDALRSKEQGIVREEIDLALLAA